MRYLITLLLIFSSPGLKSQSKEDSVKTLVNLSLNYLDRVFNKHDIDAASLLWSETVFLDLRGGYVECNRSYQNRPSSEMIKALAKDILKFGELPAKVEFEIEDTSQLSMSDSVKLFLITLRIKNFNPADTSLKYIAIDLGSENNGKDWKIGRDHWLYQFVYYLCRRNKNNH